MKKLRISNKADETPTIYVYDEIGPSWMGLVGADSMRLALDDMRDKKNIQVRVNSPGGDAFEGMTIYNLLKDHPAEIEIVIDGLAASAASIIAMAGNEIVMAKNAFLMIHNPWTYAAGEAKDLRKTADVLDKLKVSLSEVYANRSGLDIEEVNQMLDDETWFSAEEGIEKGMITSITENQTASAKFDPKIYNFKNAPEQIERVDNPINPNLNGDADWKIKLRKRRLELAESE